MSARSFAVVMLPLGLALLLLTAAAAADPRGTAAPAALARLAAEDPAGGAAHEERGGEHHHGGGYRVVQWEWSYVQTPYIIAVWLLLASAAKICE